MHKCDYCNTIYQPRPQVKNPKACPKVKCQKLRQRSNEKSWKLNNKAFYGKDYYEAQKEKRSKVISEKVNETISCLSVGSKFLNKDFNEENFQELLFHFYTRLGVRSINKLWSSITIQNDINISS